MSLGICIVDFVLLDESFSQCVLWDFPDLIKTSLIHSLYEGDSGLTLALISYKKNLIYFRISKLSLLF